MKKENYNIGSVSQAPMRLGLGLGWMRGLGLGLFLG
jgi:hypothetical protein